MAYTGTTRLDLKKAVIGTNQPFETAVINANWDKVDAEAVAIDTRVDGIDTTLTSLDTRIDAIEAIVDGGTP